MATAAHCRRGGRGGLVELRSSEEDEEAAREEVRLCLLSYTLPGTFYVLCAVRYDMHYAQGRAAVCM